MQEKRGLVESEEEEGFLVDDDDVEKVNEDICLSSGEERLLFEAKEEEGFGGGKRLGSIKREFLGDEVDELMKLQTKDAKKGFLDNDVEKMNEDICLSFW